MAMPPENQSGVHYRIWIDKRMVGKDKTLADTKKTWAGLKDW